MDVAALEALLDGPRDGALLRVTLAARYADAGRDTDAVKQLEAALAMDPDYTAAWKALGRLHAERGAHGQARAAFEQGLAAADRRGDQQAGREMRVFLRRLPGRD